MRSPKGSSQRAFYLHGVTSFGDGKCECANDLGLPGDRAVRQDLDISLARLVSSWVAVVESGKYETVVGYYFLTALLSKK